MLDWFVIKLEVFFDYIFPRQCVICGIFGRNLCAECKRKHLIVRERQECHVCKKLTNQGDLVHPECRQKTNLDGVFICLEYNKLILNIVEKIKYSLFYKYIEEIIPYYKDKLKKEFGITSGLVIVPVPIHRKRKWTRGFNQAELIARGISKWEFKNILVRVRNTHTQVGLNRAERLTNLDDAFSINMTLIDQVNKYQNRQVILVDDVMTTGTTLEKCASELRKFGIEKVYAVTLTRG